MQRNTAVIAAALVLFMVLRHVFWIGYVGADDAYYWEQSAGWLAHIPYLSHVPWGLRHTLVVPMALARVMLGDGMDALLLPSLLYSLGIVVVLGLWLRDFGRGAQLLGLLLVASCPVFVLSSSTANVDCTEAFFVLTSAYLFHRAIRHETATRLRTPTLLASGVLAGLGLISREMTLFYLVAMGLLFLVDFGGKRAAYLVVAAGCAAVMLAEMAAYRVLADSFLFRVNMTAHHDPTINRWIEQGAGVPLIHPLVDPVTMFLANHNFGLLGSVGVGLAVWVMQTGRLANAPRQTSRLLCTIAVVWTLIAALWWSILVLTPRYYMLPVMVVAVLAGAALARLWQTARQGLALGLGALLFVGNLIGLLADNRSYMFGEQMLTRMAAARAETIHTDPDTMLRAVLWLQFAHVDGRVTDTPAQSGELFFYNPSRATPEFQPQPGWVAVEHHAPPTRLVDQIAERLMPHSALSASTWAKLRGHPGVTLYRRP